MTKKEMVSIVQRMEAAALSRLEKEEELSGYSSYTSCLLRSKWVALEDLRRALSIDALIL